MKRLLLLAAAALAYVAFVRPRLARWGATDEEIARPMPGDGQLDSPITITNRAVTVDAPPQDVWPWLPQMGELPRGGFYSYEWIERLMGMKVDNTDRVLPEFQDPHTGDALDRAGNMTVRAIEPGHAIVFGPPPGLWLDSTWAVAVYPSGAGRTRLVSRVRAQVRRWSPAAVLMMLTIDPGQFIMERKFLLEIKKRAEALARRETASRRA
jgi:hypothetical protein